MKTLDEIKAGLTRKIDARIDNLGLTNAEVARHMNLAQPRISEMRNGKGNHSVDGLVTALGRLGVDVEFEIHALPLHGGLQ